MDEVHRLGMSRWDVRHWPTPTQVAFVKSGMKKKGGFAAPDVRDPLWWPESHLAPSEKGFSIENIHPKSTLESLGAEFTRLQKEKSEKANRLSGHMFIHLVSRMLLACAVFGMLNIQGGLAVVLYYVNTITFFVLF